MPNNIWERLFFLIFLPIWKKKLGGALANHSSCWLLLWIRPKTSCFQSLPTTLPNQSKAKGKVIFNGRSESPLFSHFGKYKMGCTSRWNCCCSVIFFLIFAWTRISNPGTNVGHIKYPDLDCIAQIHHLFYFEQLKIKQLKNTRSSVTTSPLGAKQSNTRICIYCFNGMNTGDGFKT